MPPFSPSTCASAASRNGIRLVSEWMVGYPEAIANL